MKARVLVFKMSFDFPKCRVFVLATSSRFSCVRVHVVTDSDSKLGDKFIMTSPRFRHLARFTAMLESLRN